VSRVGPRNLIVAATLCMGAACGIAAVTGRLDQLVALRLVQGFSGDLLLVGGQAMLFLAYPRRHQPLLQALFGVMAVRQRRGPRRQRDVQRPGRR
jgi:DHA2 family multidrug resistance protein